MKNKRIQFFVAGIILFFSLLLSGCKEEEMIFEESTEEYLEEENRIPIEKEDPETEGDFEENKNFVAKEESEEENVRIAVHICGAVAVPGVYEMEQGTRLYQAIELAGGFQETAEEEYLNLASVVEDGMQIVVPTKEEVREVMEEKRKEDFIVSSREETQEGKESKIDINTADEKELCTLPGIGEGRARAIIQYRTEQGLFQKVEDIMKVSGIKESSYEKMKELITVSFP